MSKQSAAFPTTVLPRLRLVFALSAIAAATLAPSMSVRAQAVQATPAVQVPVVPPSSVQGLPDFTGLVETVGPAVVNIRTSEKVKAPVGGQKIDPNIEEFFKRFGIPIPKGGVPGGDDGDDEPERRAIG